MERPTKSQRLLKPLFSKSAPTITTLYELIETVNEEIKPGEKHLVSLMVDHILFTGRKIQSNKKNITYIKRGMTWLK